MSEKDVKVIQFPSSADADAARFDGSLALDPASSAELDLERFAESIQSVEAQLQPEDIEVWETLKSKIDAVRNRVKAIEIHPSITKLRNFLREKIDKLGITGLLIYNLVDGLSRAIPTYFIVDGTPDERIAIAGAVGGVAIITNVTFYTALALIALKVRSILSDRRQNVLETSLVLNSKPEGEDVGSEINKSEGNFEI